MTPDDLIALGKRAVVCKNWRWMRGMLRQDDYRYIGSGVWARWSDVHSLTTALHSPDQWPDLTDPATRGCLLTLVREAWRCVVITSPDYDEDELGGQRWNVTGWRAVETVRWLPIGVGSTEAEALVAALEEAP